MGVASTTIKAAKSLSWQVERALQDEDDSERRQIAGIADALVDKIYIDVGTLLEFGIRGDRVWQEVHRANMAKRGGPKREDGKQLKPEGWQPPDVLRAVYGGSHDEGE